MEAIMLPIYNTEGKEVDTVKLDAEVFDGTINKAVMYQAVLAYRANQRSGLASTKTRGEVSGGGRKPWRQKGTGRARAGSTRSPLWRHGGVIFGPHPRDFSYRMPDKIKKAALKSSLNAKVKENNLVVLDSITLGEPKTQEVSRIFSNLKIKVNRKEDRHLLLVLFEKIDEPLKLAMRNIRFLDFNLASDTHAYEVLSHRRLIVTKAALRTLSDRLQVQKERGERKAKAA